MSFEKIFGLLVMFCSDNEEIPTKSAFSQTRAKFKNTAFIELREDTVKDYYEDGNYKK